MNSLDTDNAQATGSTEQQIAKPQQVAATEEKTTPPQDQKGDAENVKDAILDVIRRDLGLIKEDTGGQDETPNADTGDKGKSQGDRGQTKIQEPEPQLDQPSGDKISKPRIIRKKPVEDVLRERNEELVRKLDEKIKAAIAEPKPQQTAQQQKDEEPDTSDWSKEEIAEYELAKIAATVDPQRYGDLPKKFLTGRKEIEDYIDRVTKDDPDHDFESDEEFQSLVESKLPSLPDDERTRVLVHAELERARPTQTLQEKISRLERTIDELRIRPKIESIPKTVEERTNWFLKDKQDVSNVIQAVKTKLPDSSVANAIKTVEAVSESMAARYVEALHTSNKLDPKNQLDNALIQLVENAGKAIASLGEEQTMRNGKVFVPPVEYYGLSEEERARAWTFDEDDVLTIIAAEKARQLEAIASDIIKARDALSGTPEPNHSHNQQQNAQGRSSPTAFPNPLPPQSKSNTGTGTRSLMDKDELEALGLLSIIPTGR